MLETAAIVTPDITNMVLTLQKTLLEEAGTLDIALYL